MFVDPNSKVLVPGAQRQSTTVPVLVGLFAAVGGFIYGYDTGIINSISEMEYVRRTFASNGESFTASEMSILTAILSLGTFFGALTAPLISDTFGRKVAIIFATFVVFIAGNLCQVAASTILLLCIGRFITGLSVGIISAVVPLYQAEASPKYLRGAIISTYQWAITWGLLVSSAISQATHSIDNSASYRVPIGLQFLWSLILGFGMLALPESPRFYVRKDDIQAAAKALSRLRRVPANDPGLIEELVEIKASHDYELSYGSYSTWDCFKSDAARPHQLKRLLTSICLQALQQCSGINFIFYYGVNFFTKTGVSNSYLISLITYLVNVALTVPGLFLVETIGRRKILLFGAIVMTIANLLIGIVGVTTDSVIANKVMIALVCLFIAAFAATWGPVVWVVTGEIFSLGVRGKAVALSAATNWIVNFVFAYITPYLVDTGNHTAALGTKIFFLWGGFNLVSIAFVYFMVYEMRGLSLEEIDELYRSCPSALVSSNFVVKLTFDHGDGDGTELEEYLPSPEKREDSSSGPNTTMLEQCGSRPSSEDNRRGDNSTGVAIDKHYSTTTDYSGQDHSITVNPGYTVDLGYSLGAGRRGPPSLNTMSSDEESIPERDHIVYESLSGYVASLSSRSEQPGGDRSYRGSFSTQAPSTFDSGAPFGHISSAASTTTSSQADKTKVAATTSNDPISGQNGNQNNVNTDNNNNGNNNNINDITSTNSNSGSDTNHGIADGTAQSSRWALKNNDHNDNNDNDSGSSSGASSLFDN